MAERAAKAKLLTSENKLKTSIKELNDKCAGANSDQVLSRSIGTLRGDWNHFENHHNAFVEVATIDDLVRFFEDFNNLYGEYHAAIEGANALIASRIPQPAAAAPAPPPPTAQEQYDLASQLREESFTESEEIVNRVANYLKEKREETPASLKHQREELSQAKELLKQAEVFTTSMATLMPNHGARDRTNGGIKKREVKGLICEQLNALSLLDIAAPIAHVAATTSVSSRDLSYMYERRSLPKFEGERRDYPAFRREWQSNVSGKFPVEYELRELKLKTPGEVEPDLKNLKTVADVWEFLDRKYGSTMELASELVSGLQDFQYSNKAKTESAKFAELHREWTKVYNDLEEVGELDALDHKPTLTGLSRKMPTDDAKKAYIDLRIKMLEECENAVPPTKLSELAVMRKFMKAERRRQEAYSAVLTDGGDAGQGGGRDRRCSKCGKPGHRPNDCPGQGGGRSYSNQQARARVPCPACDQTHTFTGREGREITSTRLWSCPTFKEMGISERVSLLQKVNGCAKCLDYTGRHQREHCLCKDRDGEPFTCNHKEGDVLCGKDHHWLLHGTTNKFACYVQVNRKHITRAPTEEEIAASQQRATLMQLQQVPVKGSDTQCLTFFDSGSNIHLVRKEFAAKLGLKGKPTVLDLSTTGQKKELMNSTVYWVPLLDRQDIVHHVMAYELEDITAPMVAEDVSAAEKLFPMVSKGALKRPSGPVDLLVGMHMAGIFPYLANREQHLKGNLRLMTSIFGSGWLLDGDHAEIRANVVLESPEARALTRSGAANYVKINQTKACFRVAGKVSFSPPECKNVMQIGLEEEMEQVSMSHMTAKRAEFQFPECEELGAGQPRSCGSCTTCVRCSKNAVTLTRKEQKELNMIEENVSLDLEKQEVRFHDPLVKEPKLLGDKRHTAKAIATGGVPAKVVGDRGSQLTSKGNSIAWEGDDKQDGSKVWEEAENVSAGRGTRWEFVPAGAQFRNELAEARVKVEKETLKNMLMATLVSGKPTLSYAELATVLTQAANIVNDRPIWAKVLTEGDLVPLTVNQLLLGRTSTSPPSEGVVMGEEGDYMASSSHIDNLLNAWWSLWRQQGFASLLPYNKLKDQCRHKNFREGDICLLQYENKVKNTYRLCRVTKVKESKDGLMRTVKIKYRAKRKSKLLPNVSVLLTSMDVAIQRLVFVVPSEAGEVMEDEAWNQG